MINMPRHHMDPARCSCSVSDENSVCKQTTAGSYVTHRTAPECHRNEQTRGCSGGRIFENNVHGVEHVLETLHKRKFCCLMR